MARPRLLLHNPALRDREEVAHGVLLREELFGELVCQLRQQPPGPSLRHLLLIGQRGMGKTTLLLRLDCLLREDPELSRRWIPVLLPEEQYGIGNLADLWLETLRTLDEGAPDPQAEALLRAGLNEDGLAEEAFQLLAARCDRAGRQLVLLVDNLNTVLSRLPEHQAHALRKRLMFDGRLLMIGTATSHFSEISQVDGPFYEFFRTFRLEPLSAEGMERFVAQLAERQGERAIVVNLAQDPARLRRLHLLTGGNPRIALLLYQVLGESPAGSIRQDLELLLDEVTPFYKHQIESLEGPQQRIFHAVARNWHPLPLPALALELRISEEDRHLGALVASGFVEELVLPDGGLAYQVAERLYNIYYLMRLQRRGQQDLLWLISFMEALFTPAAFPDLARKALSAWAGSDDEALRNELARYVGAIAERVPEPAVRLSLVKDLLSRIASPRELTGLDLRRLFPAVDQNEGTSRSLEEAAVQYAPDAMEFWLLLGLGRLVRHERQGAADAFSRAQERAERSTLRLITTSLLHLARDEAPEALLLGDQLLSQALQPELRFLAQLICCALDLDQGQPLEAAARLEELVQLGPQVGWDLPLPFADLATLYKRQGDLERAMEAAQRAAGQRHPDVQSFVMLAELLLRQGDLAESRAAVARGLAQAKEADELRTLGLTSIGVAAAENKLRAERLVRIFGPLPDDIEPELLLQAGQERLRAWEQEESGYRRTLADLAFGEELILHHQSSEGSNEWSARDPLAEHCSRTRKLFEKAEEHWALLPIYALAMQVHALLQLQRPAEATAQCRAALKCLLPERMDTSVEVIESSLRELAVGAEPAAVRRLMEERPELELPRRFLPLYEALGILSGRPRSVLAPEVQGVVDQLLHTLRPTGPTVRSRRGSRPKPAVPEPPVVPEPRPVKARKRRAAPGQ